MTPRIRDALLVWLIGLQVAGGSARATAPTAAFAQLPDYSRMALSPDGKYVAYLRDFDGRAALHFTDLETMKISRVEPGLDASGRRKRAVASFQWVGDQRVAFLTTIAGLATGLSAVDRNGKNWRALTGSDSKPNTVVERSVLYSSVILHAFDDENKNILVLGQRGGMTMDRIHADVVKINSLTGMEEPVAENPGNVVAWGVDHAGSLRLGITADGLKFGTIYRDRESQPWQPIASPQVRGRLTPLSFDGANEKIFVGAATSAERQGIFLLNPATGELGEPLVADDEYDVFSPAFSPQFNGESLNTMYYSEQKRAIIGVRSVAEGPRVRWFDKDLNAIQAAVDRALPATVNLITSSSRDDQRLLVLASSDRDPGTYYLFDVKTRKLRPLAVRMPDLKPAEMADMFPIKYPARDGLMIHGYLTFPPGRPKRGRPMVVLPHGGPWVRDVWGFDPLVQLLANRGYAVLQVNYRGSTGYGAGFSEKGRREIGRGIQDDIEDGTRWAIAQGFAAPQRVAIMGASYGGYSALFALGKSAGLYRCGISIAGVSDWLSIIKGRDDPDTRYAYLYWLEQIGDPAKDEALLRAISPANFADQIKAPVLIIQGGDDVTVPPNQARIMTAALRKSGNPPEELLLPEMPHTMGNQKERLEMFQRIESFLAKHLPAEDPQ